MNIYIIIPEFMVNDLHSVNAVDHRENGKQPTTEIVSIGLKYMQDIEGSLMSVGFLFSVTRMYTVDFSITLLYNTEPKVLVSGSDFYAFPRLDPKDERLAWIEWSHPNMPWDKAQLYVGCISESG